MLPLPQVKIAAVLCKQLTELAEKPSDGISIIPSQDPFNISADIEGPTGTPYENGVFRCVLKVDEEFPQKPPKGYFLTKLFHPNVSPAGEICVNTLKKDWDPTKWSLRHIFEVIRCLLIVPFPESSLNEEAGKLFMENYEEYAKAARVYCSVYAKKKVPTQSSENRISPEKEKLSPKKETAVKSEEVLGSLTLNQHSTETKAPAAKAPTIAKKKWIKRI